MKVIKGINTLCLQPGRYFLTMVLLGRAKLYVNYFFFLSVLQDSLNMCKAITCLYSLIAVSEDIDIYKG